MKTKKTVITIGGVGDYSLFRVAWKCFEYDNTNRIKSVANYNAKAKKDLTFS